MALDCFLNVSLDESYCLWQGGERKKGLPVKRLAERAGDMGKHAGWSMAAAHGGAWREEVH